MWLEAAAAVQAEVDADLRADALEVYRAEAARSRLCDRRGSATVALRCGRVLTGSLGRLAAPPAGQTAAPDGFLELIDAQGRLLAIAPDAVLAVRGSRSGLRDELTSGPTLASVLRGLWAVDGVVKALGADGTWLTGRVVFVGADHVELHLPDETLAVPFSAVEAWVLDHVA